MSLIPGLGRSPGEGNGNPFQYSCLGNPMNRGAWWATVHGVEKSWTRLSDFTFIFLFTILFIRSVGKEFACNTGDLGSIPGLGRFPWRSNGNPLQYLCLQNPMDRGAWWATVHGVEKCWTQLSNKTTQLNSKRIFMHKGFFKSRDH